jgi:hypothetical protein
MPQSFTFNGNTRRILLGNTEAFSAQELYSRWKDWVQVSDNSKYEVAFRSVAGDPVSETLFISPYFFLNTPEGWRIQPAATEHELRIEGNLYSEDPDLTMFVLSEDAVNIIINRSVNAQTVSQALTPQQAAMLLDIWRLMGLDSTNPTVVKDLSATLKTRKVPADGSLIDQTLTDNTGEATTTIQRL